MSNRNVSSRRVLARILAVAVAAALNVFATALTTLAVSPTQGSASQSDLNVAANEINTVAFQSFPDSYGGVQIGQAGSLAVSISRVDPTLVTQVDGIAAAAGVQVMYRYVKNSLKQLIGLEQRTVADRPTLRTNGVTIVDVHPDVASNRLIVTLETPVSANTLHVQDAQGVLDRTYGSNWMTVSSKTMMPPTEATYRYDDYAAFFGGDQIGASGYGYCSSGFAEYSSVYHTSGVLTAGHCFPVGAAVYVDCQSPPSWCCGQHGYGFGNFIGNIKGRAYPPLGGISDFEITNGSTSGVVWAGNCYSQFTYKVKGVFDPPVGTTMSFDGSVTEEVDGASVTEDQGCVLVGYPQGTYDVCDVGSAQGSSAPCHGGDSGGPAFVFASGGVKAAGTIVSTLGNTCWFQDAWWEQYSGNLTILTQ